MPKIVAKILPATCPMIIEMERKYSWCEINVTVSAENVEKVVKPPRNPVAIARRAASDKNRWLLVTAIKIPIKKPPTIFAANVPRGMDGKMEFNMFPSHQRSIAPSEAPMQIEKKFVTSIHYPK